MLTYVDSDRRFNAEGGLFGATPVTSVWVTTHSR
jgi:hypothetical protein